jgi:ABC-type branched-subunit amino acid transport system substrate-binding protein
VKNFTAGNYVSFFAPDVTTIPQNAKVVAAFHKQYPGATSPFGAPNYVLAQMYANAITKACKDGKISRAEVRKDLAKVSLPSTILGTPIRFTAKGDLAAAKFHIFKIVNGKYVTVQ